MRLLATISDMLECRRVAPLLQPFLDGELDQASMTRVAAHVEACRRCGLEAETYTRLKQALRDRAEEPDRAAVERLSAFVEHLDEDGA